VIASAAVQQAQAQVEQAMTQLALLEVRAPVAGTILQINVRPGEAVAASPGQSLVVMGNLKPYHVRVSIDEEDIPRLKLNSPARAKLRGDLQQREIPCNSYASSHMSFPRRRLRATTLSVLIHGSCN
jgi:multidrug resistance efflux pump